MEKEEFNDFKARFVAKHREENPKLAIPRKRRKRKLTRWERRAPKKRRGPKRKPKRRPELYALEERPKKEWNGPGWAPWEIKGALNAIQENTYSIAHALGIKQSHVSCVISRQYTWLWRKNLRARFRIADLLDGDL